MFKNIEADDSDEDTKEESLPFEEVSEDDAALLKLLK